MFLFCFITNMSFTQNDDCKNKLINDFVYNTENLNLEYLKYWDISLRAHNTYKFDYNNVDSLILRFYIVDKGGRSIFIRELLPVKDTIDRPMLEIKTMNRQYPFDICVIDTLITYFDKNRLISINYNSEHEVIFFNLKKCTVLYFFNKQSNFEEIKWLSNYTKYNDEWWYKSAN